MGMRVKPGYVVMTLYLGEYGKCLNCKSGKEMRSNTNLNMYKNYKNQPLLDMCPSLKKLDNGILDFITLFFEFN
ncbi:hypothetical protein HanIR_Chr08g0362531 [Helianthus annuus]|nr:hypothetical protein HanIR_Chr08g0362531 [Helianthus annuus]